MSRRVFLFFACLLLPLSNCQVKPTVAVDMVYVEGGSFLMGSNDGDGDEKPVHQVTVSSFYIGKHEVTVGQFGEFAAAAGYKTQAEKEGGAYVWTGKKWETKKDANWMNPYFDQTNNSPVVCISWYDAVEYCNWLSRKEGLTPCYRISGSDVACNFEANGYRLPTEAEWEYAARGGNQSRGYKYSGSDKLDEVGWYWENSSEKTHFVGTKKSNELGIYDMSGNVWEWCWDWYGAYTSSLAADPRGAHSGEYRVLRGGSWHDLAYYTRCEARHFYFPLYPPIYIGFRCVR